MWHSLTFNDMFSNPKPHQWHLTLTSIQGACPASPTCGSAAWFFCIAMMLQLLHHDPTMTQPGPRTGQNAPADSNYMELVPSPKFFRTSMTSIWSAFFRRRSQVLFHHRVIFGSCWNCACESFFRLCPETKFTPIPGLKPRGPIGPSDFSSKKYRMGPPSYNLIYKPWNNPH